MNNKTICLCLLSLLLTGCVQGPTVTEENALEVAIDDSNNDSSEVLESEVTKKDNVYNIVFTTEAGQYTYKVGTDGLVKERDFSSETTLEMTENDPESKEEKKDEKIEDKENNAINAALSNVGLSRDQTTSITADLTEDGTQYTVTIVAGDTTTVCIVDANSNDIISTSFQ